jgi:asparagine synthetase B (glutamine-hydrolysing)
MCGIAGLIRPAGTGSVLRAAVAAMIAALAHRGPDDSGV